MTRDWEQHYLEGVTPWDHGVAAPPLRQILAEWPREWWGGGPVLVPGCGRGHDAALLAEAGLEVIGLDLAESAVEEARGLYGGVAGLRFEQGDLFEEGIAARLAVRAVWEHTCFCAIDPKLREAYVRTMAALLGPGERLLGVFFLDPEVEEGPPFGATREEIEALFHPFFRLGREEVPRLTYPSRGGVEWLAEFIRKD